MEVKIPPVRKLWAICPYCKAKTVLYDDQANCSGIWIKCRRGCGMEHELVIKDGKQKMKR